MPAGARRGLGVVLAGGVLAVVSCTDSGSGGDSGGWSGERGQREAGTGWREAGWTEAGRLPTAFVGVPYRFQLARPQERASWSRAVGLPEGFALDAAGVLSGVPRSQGVHRLRFREAHGGRGYEARLRVSRKRWLAFLSDERASGHPLLYLTDLRRNPARARLLLDDMQPRAEVLPGDFRFAPAEEALAFLVDATRDGVRELHAVELGQPDEGGPAEPPVRVDHGVHVVDFAWSPDARSLAYVSEEGGRREAHVVPWPMDGSRQRLGRAGGTGRISWIQPGLLVFGTPDGGSSVFRRGQGGFEVVGRLPVAGGLLDARGEAGLFGEEMNFCAGSRHRIDFGSLTGAGSPPPLAALEVAKIERTARVEHGTLQLMSRGHVVANVPIGSCDAVSWSTNGELLVSIDDARRVRVSVVGERAASHVVVEGSYGPALPEPRPELDPSGSWLKFHDAQHAYLSRVEGGQPGPAIAVARLAGLSGGTVEDSLFLPGGALVFLARAGRRTTVQLLDLSGGAPRPRLLGTDAPPGLAFMRFAGVLADGSWLGVTAGRGDRCPEGSRNIWLVSVEDGAVAGVLAVPGNDCIPTRSPGRASGWGTRCASVSDALFQP